MKAISSRKHKVLMIHMSQTEALQTIRSLSEQISTNNPNHGRFEKFLDDGRDFSIAVDPLPALPEAEELAGALRAGYAAIIKEADTWWPLASHVLDLIKHYRGK